jgi:hypothetical protein
MNLWLVNNGCKNLPWANSNLRTGYKLLKILVFAKMAGPAQLENSLKPVDIFKAYDATVLYVIPLFCLDKKAYELLGRGRNPFSVYVIGFWPPDRAIFPPRGAK